jgi:uncharacterized protein (TIGR02246 family)
MIDAMKVVETMCERYQAAVSANDSAAYGKLFFVDAIRVPPGAEPEHGPREIAQSEQNDYDLATWTVKSKVLDALRIDDDWVYGIAEAAVTTVAHGDHATKSFKATKTWLLRRDPSGEWLIKRQMWNLK